MWSGGGPGCKPIKKCFRLFSWPACNSIGGCSWCVIGDHLMQRDDSIVSLPFKLQGADFAAFMFILIARSPPDPRQRLPMASRRQIHVLTDVCPGVCCAHQIIYPADHR